MPADRLEFEDVNYLDQNGAEQLEEHDDLEDAGVAEEAPEAQEEPEALTEAERRRMEDHSEIGYRLLTGSGSDLLETAATIAWTHHERWDATGYPRRLAGEEIPMEGRITAVMDVFDALTHDRVYRPAMTVDRALEIVRAGRGSHFDPAIVDAFLDMLEELLALDVAGHTGATPV